VLAARGLGVRGLAPFDLSLEAGECVALSGPSGSGKTLSLRALADLDPGPGAVTLDGVDREAIPAPAWRRQVAYVAAEPGWWAERAGAHFVDAEAAGALMPMLGLAPKILDQAVSVLSTGERQRLALARALVIAPRVLLLDEPTGGLDAEATEAVERVLRGRLGAGTAILLVSHDRAQAQRLADRRLEIAGGRLGAAA